jgi:hypothetical protein
MRRGRVISVAAAAFAATALIGASNAIAATPQDICKDLQDGKIDGTYTNAEWTAFLQDPTVQGYCSPIVVVLPQPPPTTTTVVRTTPPPTTTETTVTTAAPATAPAVPLTPAVSAVKGARATVTSAPASQAVKGNRHTVLAPVSRNAAPLAATKTRGTLPFTGAQLTLFALVGLALLATGVLLRSTARQSKRL